MNNKVDSIEALRVFLRVAELKSFKRAADSLNLPYSTTSALIQRLEKQVQTTLFIRSTRTVRLSEAGKRFYPKCADIISMTDLAIHALHDDGDNAAGTLVISAPVFIGQKYIAPLLPQFISTYPNIKIRLQVENRFVDTVSEQVDIVFRVGNQVESGMIAKELVRFSGSLCASPRYEKSHCLPERPEELQQHILLSSQPETNETTWRLKHQSGNLYEHKFPTGYACNEVDVILQWVLAGLGIAWVPTRLQKSVLQQNEFLQVLPQWQLERPSSLWLGYHERTSNNPLVRKFIDYFMAKFSRTTNFT